MNFQDETQDYLLIDVSTKARYKSQDFSGGGHKDTLKRRVGIFFLVMKLHCQCAAARAVPLGSAECPGGVSLGSRRKGQPGPEQQASINSAAPRLRVERAPNLTSVRTLFTPLLEWQPEHPTWRDMQPPWPSSSAWFLSKATQGVESTQDLESGGLREKGDRWQ